MDLQFNTKHHQPGQTLEEYFEHSLSNESMFQYSDSRPPIAWGAAIQLSSRFLLAAVSRACRMLTGVVSRQYSTREADDQVVSVIRKE